MQCYSCKAETELYDRDIPVCLKCCDALDAKRKKQEREAKGYSPPESRKDEESA